MRSEIKMCERHYQKLCEHLLSSDSIQEEAAFLLAKSESYQDNMTLSVQAVCMLTKSDLAAQSSHYLELSDETRAALFKRAYRQDLCLIETHSHLGPYPAAFSLFDIEGLRDTVRHMMWRLQSRPYAALVFTHSGYDGLVWPENSQDAQPLAGIRIDRQLKRPTNQSITMW